LSEPEDVASGNKRHMRHALLLLAALAPLGVFAAGKTPAFVPLPAKVEITEGRFKLDADTAIVAPAALANEAGFLAAHLRTVAGLPAPIVATGKGVTLALDTSLPTEGYSLEITPAGVTIKGGSPAGVFYGVQTFMQALPAAVYGVDPAPRADWSAPCLSIQDAPTTTWRGLMLDSARHFQPKAFLLKFIDAMAAQKLNRLHWHLVDSEGWRLEIKKYPKLTEVTKDAPAYYPQEIPTNPTFRAKYKYGYNHGGGHYTQEDVREIVAYAATRHVVIVPEIEFPGHAKIALTAYPEFSTTRKVPEVRSNIAPDLFGVHPEAIVFLKDVLDETTALFPGPWIHFGGDEAPKGQWKQSKEIQAKIDALGLRINDPKHPNASEDALQGWLFNEMAAHVAKKGRKAVGWEEIMHGDNINRLVKGSVIMPWLSVNNAVKSANSGYGIVFTNVGPFYLDSYQAPGPGEPSALYGGPLTAQAIHRFDIFPGGVTPENRKNILGAQCQLWSELMPRTDDVEYQAYPRACALAELTWTAPERRKDTEGFMLRLVDHGARLTALGLNHRRVAPPSQAGWSAAFLAAGQPWEFPVPPAFAKRVADGEKLSVKFKYTEGGNGLDISAVELLADGKIVATDKHAGFTGGGSRNNTYTLVAPKGVKPDKLTLRVAAKGAGGSDSAGEVEFGAAK
jgi:hexosaminidase